ncbi:rab proteins geranylgeranyltransferase component A 2-like isoform X1 [Amphibalanus amphitrite]|uniref:rab proteins geranylgeranyltransferase component A 2-like isoform X1 n=2 Tax=Amphibalanus amphitrite TaxID=1232801 RepID=UPI001C902801|nr:rab proteins geranylgeranyltransferase component A 2-like isoform X1 [Amphibalanus amphitrite]
MEELPTDYEAIVVGTGLVESIYAAAAARVGKSVLHIDRNTHYSGEWAVLGLTALLDWVSQHADDGAETPPPAPAELSTRSLRHRRLVHGMVQRWAIEEGEAETDASPLRWMTDKSSDPPVPAEPEVAETSTQDQPPADGDQTVTSAVPETATDQLGEQVDQDTGAPVAQSSQEEAAPKESPETAEAPSASVEEPGSEDAAPASPEEPVEAQPAPRKAPEWTINRMKKLSRRFNIDLAPKVLYSRGALVELLISSSIARYAEFRSVGQLLTPLGDRLQPVPSSRADVFTTKHVSVVEKRLLMKLLSFCAELEKHPEEYAGFEDKPFSEFLKSRRLTHNLTHHVTHAIAMVSPETPTLEALRSTQKFLLSLGRYGNTPFLWPMYGSGEIPQCFCRLCAVFGGVYHLSRGVDAVTVDEDGALTGVVSDGQRFTCRRLVLEDAYRPETAEGGEGVSRAVIITDGPLYPPADDQVLLIRLPACDDHPGPVTVLQAGPAASAAPAGLYVIHLTCAARRSAEEDLAPAVARLQQLAVASQDDPDESPAPQTARPIRVLYSLYFSRRCGRGASAEELPENVAFCSGPDDAIGFDAAVQEARDLFTAHFPGEEFLPRAPDPEEIIFFDEPNESVVTGGAQPTETAPSGQEPGPETAENGSAAGAGDSGVGPAEKAETGTEVAVEAKEDKGEEVKSAKEGDEGAKEAAAGDGVQAETA